jgi:YaiO family outer membrane protein
MRRLCALFALVACALAPATARAGELDLSGNWSTLTPSNIYGPWNDYNASFRWNQGPADKPGVAVESRVDSDSLSPTSSFSVAVDDYHDWNRRVFSYAAIQTASGNLLPTRSAYVETDGKFGPALQTVVGVGAGVVVNPNGVVQHYLNIGPTYYGHNFNVTLRWLPTFTSGDAGTSTGIFTGQYGEQGKTVGTLTVLVGTQPPGSVLALATPSVVGQRAFLSGIGVKHWTSAKGGFTAGIEFEQLNDRFSGDTIYDRRGFTFGLFRYIGPAPN